MRLSYLLVQIFVFVGFGLCTSLERATAQYYPPPIYNDQSNGAIVGRGVEQMYDLSQQQAAIRDFQQQRRQNWVMQQYYQQQWNQQQNNLRYLQQGQANSFIGPYHTTTPMFVQPVSPQYQQRITNQWQQGNQSRNQLLRQWHMPLLPGQ